MSRNTLTINNNLFNKQFKLQENKTNIKTELLAGLATFSTMGYILFLVPKMLEGAGMPPQQTLTALILVVATISIAMGLFSNRPFVLASGLGSCSIFASTLVQSLGVSWQIAAGIIFISGVCFLLVTIFGLREVIVKSIPKSLKISISVAIGLKIVLLGFRNAGIVTASGNKLILADVANKSVALSVFCLIIICIFEARNFKGGVLLSIIIATIIGIPFGITQLPDNFISMPSGVSDIAFKLDIKNAFDIKYFPFLFSFFVSDFFSTFGTLLGVGARAGFLDENGDLPGIQKCFYVDSIGTIIGSLFGLPTITTYLESSVGVECGGRTGLTAITTSALFLLAIFFSPIVLSIPGAATAPAFIYVGLAMMKSINKIDFEDITEFLPALLGIAITVFTNSIGNGIATAVIIFTIMKVASGQYKKISPAMYVLSVIFVLYLYQVVS